MKGKLNLKRSVVFELESAAVADVGSRERVMRWLRKGYYFGGDPIQNFWALEVITCGIRRAVDPRDKYLKWLLLLLLLLLLL